MLELYYMKLIPLCFIYFFVQWMIVVRGIIHLEMPTGRETQRDYSFVSIYPPKTKCQNSSFC